MYCRIDEVGRCSWRLKHLRQSPAFRHARPLSNEGSRYRDLGNRISWKGSKGAWCTHTILKQVWLCGCVVVIWWDAELWSFVLWAGSRRMFPLMLTGSFLPGRFSQLLISYSVFLSIEVLAPWTLLPSPLLLCPATSRWRAAFRHCHQSKSTTSERAATHCHMTHRPGVESVDSTGISIINGSFKPSEAYAMAWLMQYISNLRHRRPELAAANPDAGRKKVFPRSSRPCLYLLPAEEWWPSHQGVRV